MCRSRELHDPLSRSEPLEALQPGAAAHCIAPPLLATQPVTMKRARDDGDGQVAAPAEKR